MIKSKDFKWKHFEPEIILWGVRWYCRYAISYCDLKEMMEERGLEISHTTPWLGMPTPSKVHNPLYNHLINGNIVFYHITQ